MTKKRIITAIWGIPILIVVTWFGNIWLFTAMICIAAVLSLREFNTVVQSPDQKSVTIFSVFWSLLIILSPLCPQDKSVLLIFSSGMVLSAIFFIIRDQPKEAFENWTKMLCGVLYVGFLFSYYVAIRNLPEGKEWVMYIIFCTFACDTASYFIGRVLGRHKMILRISPNKTWEGALAGFVSAVLASFILNLVLKTNLVLWEIVVLGILVGSLGQFGDLWESVLKRAGGIKDSGSLLPGHGGMLDRVDSLIFNGVVAYYFIIWYLS